MYITSHHFIFLGYSSTEPPQSAGYTSSVFDSAPPSAAYDQKEFPVPPQSVSSEYSNGRVGTPAQDSLYSATDYEVQEATKPQLTLTGKILRKVW